MPWIHGPDEAMGKQVMPRMHGLEDDVTDIDNATDTRIHGLKMSTDARIRG